jgi:chaperonin cofactor prefoldin
MAKSAALQKASEDARDSIDQRLQMYISNAEVLQENMKTSAMEIEKGNQIIMKQNNEIKILREKVKIKTEVIRRQEDVVNELRQKVVNIENQIHVMMEADKTKELKISSLQEHLTDALNRLTESNNVIAGNQEVGIYIYILK